MPLSGGILAKKVLNACNPPAEAPIPTIKGGLCVNRGCEARDILGRGLVWLIFAALDFLRRLPRLGERFCDFTPLACFCHQPGAIDKSVYGVFPSGTACDPAKPYHCTYPPPATSSGAKKFSVPSSSGPGPSLLELYVATSVQPNSCKALRNADRRA